MEAEVGILANRLLQDGRSNLFHFSLHPDEQGAGAICGGTADVLIEAEPALNRAALEEMERSLSIRQEGKLVTTIGREHHLGRKIERYWIPGKEWKTRSTNFPEVLREILSGSFRAENSNSFPLIEFNASEDPVHAGAFLEHVKPMPRLVIAGAGHVGKALSHLGHLLDFEVTVVDDRPEFADPSLLPDADEIMVKNFGKAMEEMVLDQDTYCVIVTRGHQYDGEALKPLVGSEAAYVGMIGSHHKVAVMKEQFLKEGWATQEEWKKIFTPVGLPIGSKTVQEIAISIAAQLVAVKNKRSLYDGK
jgi:xanthine dehydrogenase accessory factor